MQKIGFIGTGVMGSAIVKHLLKADYEVNVYNRTKSKTDDLVSLGAVWYNSPAELTQNSDIIFSMIGYPKDVKQIYFGENGIFETASNRQILVDMTTSTPSLAEEIYSYGKDRGVSVLDAPVSGGDIGANNGTLTTMVGGEEESFQKIKPILEVFSKKVHLHGPAGKGQHTKMANQIMIAGTMTGMTELLVYSNAAELDLEKVIETLSAGGAQNWSLSNYAPRILKNDYSAGFFVKHFVKDLKIALDEAEKMDIELPSTALAAKLYEKLENAGYGDDGTQAFIKLWWPEGERP